MATTEPQASYAIEAELIGSHEIPQLRETLHDLQASKPQRAYKASLRAKQSP